MSNIRIARVFIAPNGEQWVDMRLLDGQNATHVWAAIKTEGALCHPSFVVPQEHVHHIFEMSVDVPDDVVDRYKPLDKSLN